MRISDWSSDVCSSDLDAHSADELKKLLFASHRHGELGDVSVQALSHTLELPELSAGDLMRPAFDLVDLDIRDDVASNLALITQHRYSRYAVRDSEQDERYIGLPHVRDLLAAQQIGRAACRGRVCQDV